MNIRTKNGFALVFALLFAFASTVAVADVTTIVCEWERPRHYDAATGNTVRFPPARGEDTRDFGFSFEGVKPAGVGGKISGNYLRYSGAPISRNKGGTIARQVTCDQSRDQIISCELHHGTITFSRTLDQYTIVRRTMFFDDSFIIPVSAGACNVGVLR